MEDAESNARNSMSLKRAPLPPEQATRGSAVNYPFWPGGFEAPEWKMGMSDRISVCAIGNDIVFR